MAALILKQIERGTVSFAAADTTKTVTLATTLTATTKTVLLFSIKVNSNKSINHQVQGRVISTTQIQFERVATTDVACDVEYQVIEFSQGITVQHLVVTQSTATVNTTITSVTTSKAFAIVSAKQSGSTFGGDDIAYADITTSTNLATVTNNASATLVLGIQVVEIDDATVQKIAPAAWTTGATLDVTVTTIDPAKTFWFFSFNDNANLNCDQWPYCSYINTTTLRFTKSYSGVWGSKNIVLYVVSLSSGVSVQNISTVIASGAATVSPTIPNAITVANTAIFQNGLYQRLASSSEGDDNAGDGAFALSGLTTTAFTATRAASPLFAATTNVQVLAFSTATTDPGRVFDKTFEDCFEPCFE